MGDAVLYIEFNGVLEDRLNGFYRSNYTYENEVYYLATTQFEATFARRALPCWDEPSIKSIYEVKKF